MDSLLGAQYETTGVRTTLGGFSVSRFLLGAQYEVSGCARPLEGSSVIDSLLGAKNEATRAYKTLAIVFCDEYGSAGAAIS